MSDASIKSYSIRFNSTRPIEARIINFMENRESEAINPYHKLSGSPFLRYLLLKAFDEHMAGPRGAEPVAGIPSAAPGKPTTDPNAIPPADHWSRQEPVRGASGKLVFAHTPQDDIDNTFGTDHPLHAKHGYNFPPDHIMHEPDRYKPPSQT